MRDAGWDKKTDVKDDLYNGDFKYRVYIYIYHHIWDDGDMYIYICILLIFMMV